MYFIKVKKKLLGSNTLPSSSILEVITSLVIIVVIFVLFTSVYVRVIQSSYTLSHIKANSLLTIEALDTKKNKAFFNENKVVDNITITKQVEVYQGISNLYKIILIAENTEKKKLAEYKELFLDGD